MISVEKVPPIDPSGPIGGILTFLRKNFAPYRPRGLYLNPDGKNSGVNATLTFFKLKLVTSLRNIANYVIMEISYYISPKSNIN